MTTQFFTDPQAAYDAWHTDQTQAVLVDTSGTRYAVGHWPGVGEDVDQDSQWWEIEETTFFLRYARQDGDRGQA